MKTLLSFIRWKFVIPMGIFLGVTVVFFIFFFDPILERSLEAMGGKLNGAKVDIDNLKTKFLKGRLEVLKVQVADRKDPMKNRVEVGPLAFQLELSELFTKRLIIPEAKMDGIRFGTKRKTSGFLPKRKKKKAEKEDEDSVSVRLTNKYKDRFKLNLEGLKSQAKDKVKFDPKDLELTRQSEAIKEKSNVLPAQWKSKVSALNFDGRLKQAEDDLEGIKNTPTKGIEALTAIPKALEKLGQVKKDLGKIKSDAANTKKDFTNEIATLKKEVKDLKSAKKKDMDYLMSKLNLEFADPERLVEGLIGNAVMGRIQSALRFVELARKHLPSKKEKESLPKRAREGGMDIEFPKPAAPPKLWLKESTLSGEFKSVGLDGKMTHLTSDPAKVGKPFQIKLNGQRKAQTFRLDITADHTGEVKNDSFVFEAKGLKLEKVVSGGVLGEALKGGEGQAEFALMAIGDDKIGGEIVLRLKDLKFDDQIILKEAGLIDENGDTTEKLKASFLKKVAKSIEEMDEVKIQARIFGTWSDPDMKLSSNLASKLGRVVKSVVGDAAKDQKDQIEAQLNQLLKDKQSEVGKSLSALEGKLNSQFGDIEKKIGDELKKSTGLNLSPAKDSSNVPGIKIPALGDLFK